MPVPNEAQRIITGGGGSPAAVEEVAHAVGYQDASFFRRIFRAETGLSPSRFRERVGNAGSP